MDVSLDEYELYEYYSPTFTNFNTKDGYQKIAFLFTFKNTSDKEITVGGFDNEIKLTADDFSVEEAELKNTTGFTEVKSGRESYEDLDYKKVNSGDTLKGYVGFEVPKDKKNLKFSIGKNITITMDNPAYNG